MFGVIGLLLFFGVALPASRIDLEQFRIPDTLSLGGIAAFAVLRLVLHGEPPGQLCLEITVGFGAFWALGAITRGGMGLGDAKFSAFIASAAGLSGWVVAVVVASLLGCLCAGRWRGRIPFAPFLTAGAAPVILLANLPGWRALS